MSMTLGWMIGTDDQWCPFDIIDFDSECFDHDFAGVYVAWYYSEDEAREVHVVCVGHGVIKFQLAKLREDSTVCRYPNLLVTWAEVDREHQASVEAYLIATLKPVMGEYNPKAVQTIVNLPGW